MSALAAIIVFGYLALTLAVGWAAGRDRSETVTAFVAGDRDFGPVVMYFVLGATVFSAFALLGTPQRVMAKGAEVLYLLAYGSVGFAPLFFFGGHVRRIGARLGFVTQAELLGGRYDSRAITAAAGVASLLAFIPYMVIQLKGAGIVMEAVVGWHRTLGALTVYGVVTAYILLGGVRGVGWTNVVQGATMMIAVWALGLWVPHKLFGGVGPMFDRLIEQYPAHLTLPGPAGVSDGQYASEVIVTALGFAMWPQLFMKCFTARSGRLVQLSAALFPSFLFFIVPLIFLGFCALLLGGPVEDRVLIWLVQQPELGLGPVVFAGVAFAVLAASMSTGDALLHAGGSILVRDVLVRGAGMQLDERAQTRAMRAGTVGFSLLCLFMFHSLLGQLPIVELLLYGYSLPLQFLPLVLAGLYWPRANRQGAHWGLGLGLGTVALLFVLAVAAPELAALLNPRGLHPGVIALVLNVVGLVAGSLASAPMEAEHVARFSAAAASR